MDRQSSLTVSRGKSPAGCEAPRRCTRRDCRCVHHCAVSPRYARACSEISLTSRFGAHPSSFMVFLAGVAVTSGGKFDRGGPEATTLASGRIWWTGGSQFSLAILPSRGTRFVPVGRSLCKYSLPRGRGRCRHKTAGFFSNRRAKYVESVACSLAHSRNICRR